MIKKITITNQTEWCKYLQRSAQYDFYHTWHYHSMETEGDPLLLVSETANDFIAIPLIRRKIEDTNYFDLTSVYGYTGPISNKPSQHISEKMIKCFTDDILCYFKQENIISVFVRLHPFFDQTKILDTLGGLHDNGKTVYIDLTCEPEKQVMKYQASTRHTIKKLREAKGLTFREERGKAAAQKFKDIYLESMNRLKAGRSYFFSDDFFERFADTDEYDARFVMLYDKDKLISSSLVVLTNGLLQAHLIGTRSDYIKMSPGRLMVDEICRLGRRNGISYYNLGGGVGFREDNVYHWKRCFTDDTLDFKTWRYIANPLIYGSMVQANRLTGDEKVDFFPLYRYKNSKSYEKA